MEYLKSYIEGINNPELKQSIIDTSEAVCNNVNKYFSFNGQTTGLLLGNVQSGKTGQMLGVISRLADYGYRIFLLLTTDNVDLQRQTYNRVYASLPDFNVLTERDEEKFRTLTQSQPLVIVLKKNTSILKRWRDMLVASNTFRGLPLVIFDDEGDSASLNTLVNRHRTSTINTRLQEIKNTATSSLYFEVTATPQAILLQSIISDWKPSFTNYFKPGSGYLGGNFFYSDPRCYCIRYTAEDELSEILSDDDIPCPRGLQDAIYTFLILCAHKKLNGESNCNFMIHPSARINAHNQFKETIDGQLNLLQRSTDDSGFNNSLQEIWADLQRTRPDIEPFDDIKEVIIEILDNEELIVIPLNSKSFVCRDSNDPNALDLSKGFNIVVGGNTLGRGITFPHLQVVYYCRTSKKPQADTFWQHSRIFGYDREQELVRIFMPESLHKLFVDLNKANEIIIKQIENGIDDFQIVYPSNIQPTRKNVLDAQYLNVVMGGINYFPNYPIDRNTAKLDNIIACASLESEISNVSKDLMVDLLSYCGSDDASDFDSEKFISSINALSIKRPNTQFKLIVRYDRDIAKGTGTLLSPNDRTLGDRYGQAVVLTLYRNKGNTTKGWSGHPFWIPNIKLPDGYCFYDSGAIIKE
ncbi:MAG: Z1 domain-containing protein [Candidatus Cryptobacteroides sp.]